MEKLKVLIGRSSQCDFTIENPEKHGTVSGKHATISETDTPDVFTFEDHSTNGSYINGKLIHNESITVKASDCITLGRTYLLPIADIAKRYFASTKTTKKISRPNSNGSQWNPMSTGEPDIDKNATRLLPADTNATRLIPQNTDAYPTVLKPESKDAENIVEKKVIPTWYWVMFIVSVLVAFFLGLLIANI